jgi:protein SCO1/2
MADMKRIREEIPSDKLNETNFVIVSIDPERDTPERFREFAQENDLSDEQWILLHGNQGDVLELAALLGVKFQRISETDFSHSNMITLLNKQGEVVYQRKKLTDKPEQFVNHITQTNQ